MKKEELKKIVDRLNELFPDGIECPICHKKAFDVVDGYYAQPFQVALRQVQLTDSAMFAATIVCKHCGFMSNHSVGILCRELFNETQEKA